MSEPVEVVWRWPGGVDTVFAAAAAAAAVVVVECRIGEIYYEECSFPQTQNQ